MTGVKYDEEGLMICNVCKSGSALLGFGLLTAKGYYCSTKCFLEEVALSAMKFERRERIRKSLDSGSSNSNSVVESET